MACRLASLVLLALFSTLAASPLDTEPQQDTSDFGLAPAALASGDECSQAGELDGRCALNAIQLRGERLSVSEGEHSPGAAPVAAREEQTAAGAPRAPAALTEEPSGGASAKAAQTSTEAALPSEEESALALGASPASRLAGGRSGGTCSQDTFGSCMVKSCDKSRGPASCSRLSGYKCVCPSGWCAMSGKCFAAQGECSQKSGGSCKVLGCKSKRGPTDCVRGECVCKPGHCATGGTCYPVTDTGGTCKVLGCASSRGKTQCVKGKCVCSDSLVALNGICTHLTSLPEASAHS